ncbi:hypothetical protein [Demequina sp.]|uniref:hypothetical protein n=1 Tax=Demequina sp. TaxID=2050685 RepID=UPI003D1000A7
MSDIRDVLQHRNANLAQSLRNTDEFDLGSAAGTIKRKRAVRATFVGAAATVAAVAVATGAWAGYSALTVGPATSPSPSATPSGSDSASPSVTPTPQGPIERLTSASDAERLDLAANPRTGETWATPTEFVTDLDVVDDEYWVLAKVGSHDGADIVAVAPRYYEWFSGGRPIAALIEFEGNEARVIECPMPIEGELCSQIPEDFFGSDVQLDADTFYDSLALPSQVMTVGGQTVAIGTDAPLGDASAWTDLVTQDPDYSTNPWADAVDDASLGNSQSALVRAYGTPAVTALAAYDYAIRTPFGSYVRLLEEGISGLDAAGFAWDDGAPVELYDPIACADWGEGACPDRWLSAEQRCYPLAVTEDPARKEADWVAAGKTSDGRVAYLPKAGGNAVAESVYTTMRDSSWDLEGDAPNYPYTYEEFLEARSVIEFQLDDGRWIVALSGAARNNPYECA